MKTPGDLMGSQPYGSPSPFEKGVVKNIPTDLPQYLSASGPTPLQDLDGIITPNGLFYERHHAGVPTIDPAQHRLMLHGLVDRPLIFTMDDIRRFPSQSHIYFLECSGNPTYKKPYGKTATFDQECVGCHAPMRDRDIVFTVPIQLGAVGSVADCDLPRSQSGPIRPPSRRDHATSIRCRTTVRACAMRRAT